MASPTTTTATTTGDGRRPSIKGEQHLSDPKVRNRVRTRFNGGVICHPPRVRSVLDWCCLLFPTTTSSGRSLNALLRRYENLRHRRVTRPARVSRTFFHIFQQQWPFSFDSQAFKPIISTRKFVIKTIGDCTRVKF